MAFKQNQKMTRGGKRPGAGRKKGSVTKATVYRQEMLARATAEGVTPLEVMLTAMRRAWDAGEVKEAVSHAEKAAPYVHNRLAAVEHSGNEDKPIHNKTTVEHVVFDAGSIGTPDQDERTPEARAPH